MSRIAKAFETAESEGRAALIAYLCTGFPSLEVTKDLVLAAAESGADIIELGVPFSDPSADGATIQRASEIALREGASLTKALGIVREVRKTSEVPILLFGYYNPILTYGESALARDAKDAGVDGFLVVDLPPEEASVLTDHTGPLGLDFVPLIAPTSDPERVKRAREVATSFLYYVSVTGVTGGKSHGDGASPLAEAAERAGELGKEVNLPVAVGFGIASGSDVQVVAQKTKGAVVGSAILRAISEHSEPSDQITALQNIVRELREGTVRH